MADDCILAMYVPLHGPTESTWNGAAFTDAERRNALRALAVKVHDECLLHGLDFLALMTPEERNELRRRLEACK